MLLKLFVLTLVTTVLAAYFRRPAELCGTIITIGLTVLSMIVPGGRVLTIPFVTALIMIWLFWAARRSAEREEL
jgi:hypothetical protein